MNEALENRIKDACRVFGWGDTVDLINDLSTALKAEQAKNTTYKKALKTIAEWQSSSDSQDAIHAANTAIEALGDDYG